MKKFEDIFENEIEHRTGNYVINSLIGMSGEKLVYLADATIGVHGRHDFPVNDFFSWRGSYREPSISSSSDKAYTATELIVLLDDFFNSTQQGWKGGEFDMNAESKLWCDDEGTFSGKGVADIVECEEGIYIVVGKFK